MRRRGRVAIVASGDRAEKQRRVAHVAPERTDLVERRCEGDDAVAAHPAVGWLHADDAGQCRGLADRAAGVGPDRDRHVVGRNRRRRAAAAAARDALEIPRVCRRAPGRVLGRRAHRELVHVRLARQHRAGALEQLCDMRVVRADVALEDAAAGGRRVALGQDEVLEPDRNPEQGGQTVDRGVTPPLGEALVRARRPGSAHRRGRASARHAAHDRSSRFDRGGPWPARER